MINFASILVISEHCSTCIGRNSFAIVSNQNMKLNFPHVIEKCSYFVDIRITFFSLRFVLKIQNVKIVYSRLFYAWNHALFMRFSDYVYELCLYWVLKDYDLVLFRKKLWSVCWVNFLLFHRLRLFKVFFSAKTELQGKKLWSKHIWKKKNSSLRYLKKYNAPIKGKT